MDKRQLELFSKILSEGGYNCKMYEGIFDFIEDKSCVTEKEFLKIPFSYKQDIRANNLEGRANDNYDVFGIFGSSGTTGNKTYYKFSMRDRELFDQISSRILRRVGVTNRDLGVVCAPVLDGVMAHTMMWQYTAVGAGYVNCPVPSFDNFMAVLNSAHPTSVSGLPSALDFSLSPEFVVPKGLSPRLYLTGGHFFSNNKRKLIEEKWGLSWYDFLGVSEIFGPIMGECKEKYGLHYDKDLFLVEIIDQETMEPVEDEGKIGIMVITPLWCKGSPLVRYWTDDFAYRIKTPCACGEAGERIFVCGRKNDYLKIGEKYVFPRDVEHILYGHSKDFRIFVDLAQNGEIMVYTPDLSDEGKRKMEELFGCELKFSTQCSFENARSIKPAMFSQRAKEKYN